MKSTIGILIIVLFLGVISVFIGVERGFFQSKLKDSSIDIASNSGVSYDPIDYTPTELQRLLQEKKDKYVVIDARTKLEYDKGHAPGAVHADYYDIDALKKTAGDKTPITYDAFSTMRGPYAAYMLYQAGYKNVGVITGGLSAWAEDIGQLDSANPDIKTVFNHPKNIFPERKKGSYPPNKGTVEFSITAERFAFKPNRIIVEHGQKVILHLTSKDVVHGFALPEFGIEREILPRETAVVSFIADRKGNFPFVTNVLSGRDHASMVGNLIVE